MSKAKFLILIFVISIQTTFAQEKSVNGNSKEVKGTSLELPQIQVIPLKDTKANRQYELYIKLPESYSENEDKKYPVIYFTDALWHIEILSGATQFLMPNAILVGISWEKDLKGALGELGAHASRFRDYQIQPASNPDNQAKYQLGQASNHLTFVRNDVIKFIENNYRADPESRSYFGYSVGGLFGAYILLTQPSTFKNYILGSPALKGDIPYLSELNSKFGSFELNKNNSLDANVFISYGTLEKEVSGPIMELTSLLNNRRDDGLSFFTEVIEGNHETAFPMTAVRSVIWLSSLMSHVSSYSKELPFWEIPQLNKAFVTTTPADRGDGLVVGELGVDGSNKEMIVKLAREIASLKYGRFDSFLISYKDKLIFESYYKRGRIDLPHFQASATKSYTSLALGRAIQLGYLSMADLNKPLVNFLKDLDPTKFVEGVEKITLHQALTMRSGIRISNEQKDKMNKNSDQLKGQRHVQAFLESSLPITLESQSFLYQSDPSLVMQVLDAVVPGTAKDFIKNEFLGKMGITNYGWQTAISGLPTSGSRASMTSRDMVKIGILARNKGRWNGKQLIPEEYIDKAIHRIVLHSDDENFSDDGNVSNVGYGYYWWQADIKYDDKNYFSTSARGGAGQYIILIDELDLIVVVTAHDQEYRTLQMTAEKILPAFVKK